MAGIGDVASSTAAGASMGSIGGPWGAAIGAGAGLLAGIGKMFFSRSEAKRAEQKSRESAEKEKKLHQEAIVTGEERAKKLYGEYSVDPTLLKQQYQQSLQRGLEQAAGGQTAALSSQRRTNPSLAAHMLTQSGAEMGAKAAGEGAMAETQLGYQADLYNKQLAQQLRNQEIGLEEGVTNAQYSAYQGGQARSEAIRMQGINDMFNLAGQGAELGMKFSGIGNQGSQGQSQNIDYGLGNSGYSLGGNFIPPQQQFTNPYSDERLKEPWKNGTFHAHDFDNDDSYHQLLSRMHTDDIKPHLDKAMAENRPNNQFQHPSHEDMQDFERSLKPSKFQYKEGTPASDGGKKHVGVMAQNLERSEMGKTAVQKDENGLRKLDIPSLTSMLAGGVYDLNNRLKKLEGKRA